MAGYIFTLGKKPTAYGNYERAVKNGVYGTIFKQPNNNYWHAVQESTFGDYLGMRKGDHVYFFFERKIYGVGELDCVANDVKLLNYPCSDIPITNNSDGSMMIEDDKDIRVVITFKPAPLFFKKGIDMDLVLQSNPAEFKMLRVMWGVSFIKIADKEDNALFDVILRENIGDYFGDEGIIFDGTAHKKIETSASMYDYKFTADNLIKNTVSDGLIGHEMVIECDLIEKLTKNDCVGIFGKWDYVSHQVVASPFKPIDYMDKIDIFGYEKIEGFNSISRYMCVEIKKSTASVSLISQVMKYVDWIKDEYAHGDYSMIEAYVVSRGFSAEVIKYANENGIRNYTKGFREEMRNNVWAKINLIEYYYDGLSGELRYRKINE